MSMLPQSKAKFNPNRFFFSKMVNRKPGTLTKYRKNLVELPYYVYKNVI